MSEAKRFRVVSFAEAKNLKVEDVTDDMYGEDCYRNFLIETPPGEKPRLVGATSYHFVVCYS